MSDVALGGSVRLTTDVGFVVAFDPAQLQDRVKDPKGWWYEAPLDTAERRSGRYAVWPLGTRDRTTWRVRLGDALTDVERPYDKGCTPAAPLVVTSGEVFVGPGERLPGDGSGARLMKIEDAGDLVPLPPGKWALEAHVLDWRPEPRFWNEDNEPTEDAPVDVVLLAAPVTGDLPPAPPEVPALLDLMPSKKPKGSERVVHVQKHRAPIVLEVEKQKKPREPRDPREPREPKAPRSTGIVKVAPRKPGEIVEGCTVRHPVYGVGKVTFVRDGFPKAKVEFHDGEQKVDKDTLKAID